MESNVWGKSAAELFIEQPEVKTLSMVDFQNLCIDFVDGVLWDRWSDEEIADGLKIRAKHHKKNISLQDCMDLIKGRRDAHERSGIELPVPTMPDRDNLPRYIVPRRDNNYAGWFPRGHVSLIAGSSGMGKSTAMLYVLEDLRTGKPILGHPPATADYRILIVDRTLESLEESLEFKGLDTAEVVARASTVSHNDGDPAKVLRRQLRQWKEESGQQPDIVFLEGIDFWVRKNNDMDAVFQFVKTLEPIAAAWNVSIVASVGSPKMKSKENYVLTRDKVLGTSAWGRTTYTILFVERMEGTDTRKITILPRTGRDEHMYFSFVDGRAVFNDVAPAEEELARAENGLAKLNVGADLARRSAELDAMREMIERFKPGTRFQTDIFDWVKKSERTVRLNQLAGEGLVENRHKKWYRK